ncbi:MAG: phosphoribosylformylglycinamidine synthase, partial [Bacteroidales bacterium]|nr:phosphoribosylformylglycinamidine synthase [Bacteroidales bacterium]
MSTKNFRLFVEKKAGFQVEAESLKNDLNSNLHLNIKELRIINVYDLFNIEPELLEKAKYQIFAEPVVDSVLENLDLCLLNCFAVEFLPGQFDQRADSAMQCLKLLDPQNQVIVKSAKLIVLDEGVSVNGKNAIKKYCINEVEAREKDLTILEISENVEVKDVLSYDGFIDYSSEKMAALRQELSLAMTDEDFLFIQHYFKNEEHRDPTETEIKMLDTYWSDHCRHTTFETELEKISFEESCFSGQLQEAFLKYLALRKNVHGGKKPVTLMDMATICGKNERKIGNLDDLEVSEEVNACSVCIDVDVDGKIEKWLLMFKNETHNHPTEIEPFGGASTCIGGAIRDPLSGRSYVYQAMRV